MNFRKLLQAARHYKAGGLASAKRFLKESDHNHVHVVSSRPPIVYLWWGRDDEALHRGLRNQPLTVLYLFPWCYSAQEAPDIARAVKARLSAFPKHRIIFLCNEEYAVEDLRKHGVEARFIHQNAFVNEEVFVPRAGVETGFDALYNASMAPYKRHALAADVKSLMMLAYTYGGTTTADYGERTRAQLAHAHWAKDSRNDSEKVPTSRIVDFYAQARVGLCLSDVEGGMFVSMEYLLCGLGIVSTPSIGGRDVFWDDRYAIVCEASPAAVSRAVEELCRRRLAREDVRRWALERVQPHRDRFRELLTSLGAECSVPWMPGSHGVTSFRNLEALASEIRTASQA